MTDWSTTRVAAPPRRQRDTLTRRALRQDSVVRRLDWPLLMAVVALVLLGLVLVYAATKQLQLDHTPARDPKAFLKKDLINVVVGTVLGVTATLLNHRLLRAYTPVIYVLSCLGLVAVLGVGVRVNGARSWINLGGGFQLQPAEFAKIALVVGLAMFLGETKDGVFAPKSRDVILVLVLSVIPLGLIMLEPDLGTSLVIVFMVMSAIAAAGAPTRWVIGLLGAGVLLIAAVGVLHVGLHPYQINRLIAFTNPSIDPQGIGFQTSQARITIGSGGMFGTGLFHGPQTNGHLVPEQQTDFIFTVAGEELGFAGCCGIIGLYAVVLWRGLRIAQRAEDGFGRLVAVGVVAWFAFQGFENMGMAVGVMPMTGLPLPFLSYGGSAMFANLIGVGLLQNVHLHTEATSGGPRGEKLSLSRL